MLKGAIVSLAAGAALLVAIGCGNDNSQECVPTQYANAGPGYPGSGECESAGGQCSASCPAGYQQAPAGSSYSNACQPVYDPGPYNACNPPPPAAGAGYANLFCCLPDPDGGADAATDGPADARADRADAAPENGTCAGSLCRAGCSCEVLPQTGAPYCLCVDAGTEEASAPNCGTIWCFAGCSCQDTSTSTCGCP